MFASKKKTGKARMTAIPTVDKDVLDLMFKWVCGEDVVPKIQDFRQKVGLYKAADQFLLHTLKSAMRKDLLSTLKTENACDLYELGDVHGEEEFKAKAVEVMKRDSRKDMVDAERFDDSCKRFPRLLMDLCN